ncbi:ATP-NAD kinase-like domain-containing protein [Aspergillus coremiiformis]|uniref:ATP-NAD kinase-like domain-containing protein n=1 Tax=Aspergillus coremiiformis TaxID=138285 RepID=A0A5N6YTT5_9EURO|nr:ATP-NAD kinase-like domain-containing protein [Aspergillus coremiiformis]
MTQSPEQYYFNTHLFENSLRCHNQSDEIIVDVDDIVSVLPLSGDGYKLLFLQKRSDDPKTKDCMCLESIRLKSLSSTLRSQYLCTELPNHLRHDRSEIRIVLSTVSGIGSARTFHNNILQPFLLHLGVCHFKVYETLSPQTITELCNSQFIPCAEAGIHQTIILLSGDGGLADVIDALYSAPRHPITRPTIALIPTGTGNAMASSLGLTSHPAAGLKELLQGRPRPLPTFVAKFSPGAQYVTEDGRARVRVGASSTTKSGVSKIHGAVVASWGIHAALVADSDTIEYRRFGADRFKMAAQELLFPPSGAESHKYAGTISFTRWNDQTNSKYVETMESKEHMYVLVTTVPRLEREFVISPESVPLDGRLRVVYFGPVDSEKAMQLMTSAYKGGEHVHEESVFYSEIEGFRIEFQELDERWRRVCVDGKVVAVESDGWMEVHKEAECLLQILTSAACQD